MFDNHILAISLQTTFSTINNQPIVHTILVKPSPWARPIIEREIAGTVFLDLSKAFALVDQNLLLSKLGKYHMDNTSLRWFKSYLKDWTQHCHINGSLSDALTLTQGVPQGSVLGPVIFSLHINNLQLAIPNSNVDILYLQMTLLYGRPTGIYYMSSKTFRTVLLKQGVGSL